VFLKDYESLVEARNAIAAYNAWSGLRRK